MLDRVQIWSDDKQNVHYTLASEIDGSIIAQGVIPHHEWNHLRNNVIRSYPADAQLCTLTDYITVLGELIS